MSTIALAMTSPGTKRSLHAALEPSTPEPLTTMDASATSTSERQEGGSRSRTTTNTGARESCSSTPLSSIGDSSPSPQQHPVPAPPCPQSPQQPSKKRKLTFAETEVQRIEKQFKDQQRAEEAARKAEEKRQKEEQRQDEKRRREEEKEQRAVEKEMKLKAKEEEKQRKDEERQRKEAEKAAEKRAKDEEKAKKERAQLKLNSFFIKKAGSADSPASSRRSSVSSVCESGTRGGSRAASEVPAATVSEYEKAFPPFFLHSHTSLAPLTRFPWDVAKTGQLLHVLDAAINGNSRTDRSESPTGLKRALDEALDLPSVKRRKRTIPVVPVRDLVARVNGTASTPIDHENEDGSSREALKALCNIHVKYLFFREDVRPPYTGTYTKQLSKSSSKKIRRNPFYKGLPDKNYDIDSEAEWEEPEEGEELGSDDDDEEEDVDQGEMEGFLDDEDDALASNKRRNVMGDMEPISTGLLWDESRATNLRGIPFGAHTLDLDQYRISPLLVTATGPIDPYSLTYWTSEHEKEAKPAPSTMAPPQRVPLTTISSTGNLILPDMSASKVASTKPGLSTKSKAKANAKPLPPELLEDFKKAVDGNDFNKNGLIEILKKRFPSVSKNTITDTLDQVARREGKKEPDKIWVLI